MSPLYSHPDRGSKALFDKALAVNFKGPFRLSVVLGQRMPEGRGENIVNTSSTSALQPSPQAAPHAAAKAAPNALTRSLAHAHGPAVRVNAIVAGPFLTDIVKAGTCKPW